LDSLVYEPDSYYILDRGYVNFTRLYKIAQHSATFVVRAKSNLKFNRMCSQNCDKPSGVLEINFIAGQGQG